MTIQLATDTGVLACLVAAVLVGLGALLEYLVHAWRHRH